MGSKSRIPPPVLRRPHPGPGIVNPDPYGSSIRPHPGSYPPMDMFPTPELMVHKLDAQHVEMQKLARENQKLAATHESLRQQLADAQHEQKILHAQIEAVESEREKQMRNLTDKIAKLESELKATEPVKKELQQAHGEAQSLVVARQELMSRAQHLSQDLERAHADLQQMPALMSELESLRQEYQHCRATYDYEKKLYNDHLESLQAMEKNYTTMAKEVEKLRAQLTTVTSGDTKAGGPYSGTSGMNANQASGQPAAPNTFQDGYGVPQGHTTLSGGVSSGGVSSAVSGPMTSVAAGTPPYAAVPPGTAPVRPGYYGAQMQPGYDAQRGPVYNVNSGPIYDPHRRPGYDLQGGPGYGAQRASAYNMQRGSGYDQSMGTGYDPQSKGAVGTQRQVVASSIRSPMPSLPPGRNGQDGHPQGGNPVQK